MAIQKCTRSILSRLEALEAKCPGSLVFEVSTEDSGTRRVNLQELMEIREEPRIENGIHDTGLPEWRVVGGNNLDELDALLAVMPGKEIAI